jgi:methyl-accepting chemotaxis protein
MTSSPSETRTLSVSQRLATLAAAAFLGFGCVLGVGFYQNSRSEAALEKAIIAENGMKIAEDMRFASIELVLITMDTIIDREEGRIQPERATQIKESLALLDAKMSDLEALARLLGKSGQLASFGSDLAALRKAIEVDLKKLVEDGAPMEGFARLDDAVDGGGERMNALLTEITDAAAHLATERTEEARVASHNALVLQSVVGILAMAGMLGLIWFHGHALRRGILGLRDSMQRIHSGDLTSAVAALDRSDEIGEMARSVDLFRTAAMEKRSLEQNAAASRGEMEEERERQAAEREQAVARITVAVNALGRALNQLAEGNLAVTIREPFEEGLDTLRRDYNTGVERLSHLLRNLK